MALNYTSFQTYPLEINGITSEYNSEIAAIEAFVISDMAFSGSDDISAILPYFVFWYLLNSKTTDVQIKTGETMPILKDSEKNNYRAMSNWNIGVDKLRAVFGITETVLDSMSGSIHSKIHQLILASGKTVNENYLSKRSFL